MATHDGSQANRFDHPTLECNLVMKGGITSGIVYPPAVLELAPRYRFRQIGGASAGAIAAAVTGAAELGRMCGGFPRLAETSDFLARPENLLGLFQPSPAARPLFRVRLAAMKAPAKPGTNPPRGVPGRAGAWIAKLAAILWAYLVAEWWLALPLIVVAAWLGSLANPFVAVIAAVLAIPLAMVARLGWILLRVLPRQGFGICSGLEQGDAGSRALTSWLADELDRIAGLKEGPLTIGQLQAGGIELRMMTTDLSIAEPAALPFEKRDLIFHVDEMRRLFPERIVEHLIRHSYPGAPEEFRAHGYYALPIGDDLPVVFCARLSLSFPLLISTVPLHSVRLELRGHVRDAAASLQPETALQPHVFSDGGISSNFPVHFFGTWMPRRPTFGIDLTEMPDAAFAPADLEGGESPGTMLDSHFTTGDQTLPAVVLPAADRPLYPEWSPIRSLGDFLGGIWETTHTFRDNMLMQLPSFRDRIVRLRFASGEGGLNLSMSGKAITRIRAKGQIAGGLLLNQFDFEAHRWVQYLVQMAELEEGLNQIASTLRRDPGLLDRFADRTESPYERDEGWRRKAADRTRALAELVEQWRLEDCGPGAAEEFSDHFRLREPRPNPEMRLSPRV